LARLEERCGVPIVFRVAETPIFVDRTLLERMAEEGAALSRDLLGDEAYLAAARAAIPAGYRVSGESARPHFLTADFALVREADGELAPRLVEMQAFPSIYGLQTVLSDAYREAFGLGGELQSFLGGLDETGYWELLREVILGDHDPENVVLTEVDPLHQKTRPDFEITSKMLGIPVVDISTIEPAGNKLYYRDAAGRRVPIDRIYNRAIADELIARKIQLPFDLTQGWDVEWAGHPNWYFLISKFSLPWFTRAEERRTVVPPAVFLDEFLDGSGRQTLENAGVRLSAGGPYSELLLKPLFSFAGKGIQFDPSQEQLEAIEPARRSDYLLQQRMRFEPTIETPFGLTQAEIRILYLWPDGKDLMPVLALVRLGRGKMMGVDHNRDLQWVGASAVFCPE
jgi:hypothetical protein